jgi:hypothetical protein
MHRLSALLTTMVGQPVMSGGWDESG